MTNTISTRDSYLIKGFIILISFIIMYFNTQITYSKYVAIMTIIFNMITVFKVRKNWLLLIIFGFIFYSNISIVLANYFGYANNIFTSFSNDMRSVLGINLLFFTSVCLYCVLPNHIIKNNTLSIYSTSKKSDLIFLLIIIVLIFIFFNGFTKPSIAGGRGATSTLYEYSIVFFIIGYAYGEEKYKKIIISLILFLYVIQDMIYGGRGSALQLILIFFIVICSNKIDYKKAIPIIFIGMIIFTGIGNYRASFDFSINQICKVFNSLLETGFVNDTSYSAYYTSLTFLKVKEFVGVQTQLYLLFQFILYIFLGSKIVDSNLAVYTRQYYVHYYGGVLPLYMYFYLGILGIMFIVLYLKFWIKKMNESSKKVSHLQRCLCIYISACVPRWYLYSPSSLFRGVLIFIFVYKMVELLDMILKKNIQ